MPFGADGENGMKTIVLVLAYDGTPFCGWQRQEGQKSVQGCLETALTRIHGGRRTEVRGASRTDAGVHAEWQVAAFDTDRDYTPARWQQAINALTPPEIYVRSVREAPSGYHPRFAKKGKCYRYAICEGHFLPPGLLGRAMLSRPLDIDRMREAAHYLLGEHDFSSFRAQDCQASSPVRILTRIDISRHAMPFAYPAFDGEACGLVQIEVEGTAFLKQMVRILVGTLVDFGLGREPSEMKQILEAKDRQMAGETVPACGLTLIRSLE